MREERRTYEKLPNGDAELLSLEIPKGDVETREGRHENRSTSVESVSVGGSVDVLDVIDVPAYEDGRGDGERSVSGPGVVNESGREAHP